MNIVDILTEHINNDKTISQVLDVRKEAKQFLSKIRSM